MSPPEDSMARFDRVMRGLLAVPKDQALKTMAETIRKRKRRIRKHKGGTAKRTHADSEKP
jgi:hypothetical protein